LADLDEFVTSMALSSLESLRTTAGKSRPARKRSRPTNRSA